MKRVIIQDPIDLLLAKSNFTNKRWMVLVFSTCNTIHLLLVKLHFVNKRRMVLVFSTCNTIHLLLVKLHFANKRRMVLVFSTCNTIHLFLVKLHLVIKGGWYWFSVLAILLIFFSKIALTISNFFIKGQLISK